MACSQRIAKLSMLATAAMVALALTVASPAVAFPIMYVFTGTGTGMVRSLSGTTSFTDTDFEVSLFSDTTGVRGRFGQDINVALAGIVSISGLGSFNLTLPQLTFVSNQSDQSVSGGTPPFSS